MKRLVLLSILLAVGMSGVAHAYSGQVVGARADSTGLISVSDLSVTWPECGRYKLGSINALRRCGVVAEVVAGYCPDQPGSGTEIWRQAGVTSPGTRKSGPKSLQVNGTGNYSVCLFVRNENYSLDYSVYTRLLDTATVTISRPNNPGPSLSEAKAVSLAKRALGSKFGNKYSGGTGRSLVCLRQSKSKFICLVSWRYRSKTYAGQVTVIAPSRAIVSVRASA